MELTDKQRIFVEEYLTCWNATEAARRAGYDANEATLRSIGSENLTKPNIKALIDQRMKEKALSADEVLARLADIARGTLDDFLSVDRRGRIKIDLIKARKAGKMHLLKSYGKGKQGEKIELYSAIEALQILGRHLQLFVDRTEISGPNGGPIAFDLDEWKRQRQERLKKVEGDNE
jgi:phage terminase small subunit